jgi:DNA-binding response OmpR family regulator
MAQRIKERRTLDDGNTAFVSPSILLIDDDDDSRNVLLYQLSLEGYRCRGAATGMAGVRAAREIAPDVILLDLNLPDIHGLEVIKLMQAEQVLAAIPIVVISGERSIVAARAIAIGAAAFHAKPLDFGELLETLHSLDSSSPQPAL